MPAPWDQESDSDLPAMTESIWPAQIRSGVQQIQLKIVASTDLSSGRSRSLPVARAKVQLGIETRDVGSSDPWMPIVAAHG